MHLDDLSLRRWLQERMEGTENRLKLSREEQLRIFKRVARSSSRNSSGKGLLAPRASRWKRAGEQRIDEVVLAMAYRGRLNVLANIIGKSPREIFWELEDP